MKILAKFKSDTLFAKRFGSESDFSSKGTVRLCHKSDMVTCLTSPLERFFSTPLNCIRQVFRGSIKVKVRPSNPLKLVAEFFSKGLLRDLG